MPDVYQFELIRFVRWEYRHLQTKSLDILTRKYVLQLRLKQRALRHPRKEHGERRGACFLRGVPARVARD